MESLATHHYLPEWSRSLQSGSVVSWFSSACFGPTARSGGGREEGTEPLLRGSLNLEAQRGQRVELVERGLRPGAVRVLGDLNRPRAKPALDKFDSLDALRLKVQGPP